MDFVLYCSNSFNVIEDKHEIEEAIVEAEFEINKWKNAKENAIRILDDNGEALSSKDFFTKFSGIHPEIKKDEFFTYVSVSRQIKKGVFGKWGIAHWGEINPKGIRQKAHLIIKESRKPLHFKEVASLVDNYKLNKKKTHPQTVHNELIKDDNFVLVGRGTYALKEWGYQRGTVKDVIEEILKSSKLPIHQDKIVKKVLSVRDVKEATVIINLNKFFDKKDNRTYHLKELGIKERV
jgi:DNA-directed RNA polymerase delta subunit